MSMDLAKKSFSIGEEYFIAGTTIGITTAVKTAGEALVAHTPVLLGEDGKVTAIAEVDDDHALSTTGLYGITADSAASGKDAVIYLTGEFFAEKLALADGVAPEDIEIALRNIGIFLKYAGAGNF